MVDKKQIDSILTNIINTQSKFIDKCKKPSYSLNSLNNYVKNAFNKFSEKYAFSKEGTIEHALSVMKNGYPLTAILDGDKTSVPTGHKEAFDSLIEFTCEDILRDYEYHNIKQDDAMNKIINRLNETGDGIFHIHNHPGYASGTELDTPICTNLSEADCVNTFLNPSRLKVGNMGIPIYNDKKCQMAVCSNGTSMILINHNPVTRNVDARGYTDTEFKNAWRTLHNEWSNYVRKSRDDIGRSLSMTSIRERVNKNRNEYKGLDGIQIRDKIRKEVYKEINDKNKKEFPKFASKAVQEFKELGFELKFDFSDVVLE